ncbi:beta-ketoacyl synthase chain length factor [Noviherbaspirillum pedocola]|uniref:Beta-ketoacyl synthase chain length factor n=1 Tax=Noviherbaspirillum pedocola TaxID=2801341 RepID=A0A934W2T9_9BURK|nr:beta-ketoacyl synthase chain length factor [Noviherbaspirillum pedocola]MBK4736691.1 beta-ketoacyl synthase chain length factor [Noviherbaspirillum pedocola]
MSRLFAHIDGIGLLGPGLNGWEAGSAVLARRSAHAVEKTLLPPPAMLPAAERRRSGPLVRLALAVGAEAGAGQDLSKLPTVFSASSGDGANCHEICQMLAAGDTMISPTRFHNSVHNAASGYWSIGAGAMENASVLCAHDASFGAGLLEAMAMVAVDGARVLLVVVDSSYPEPLRTARPIPDDFGVALLLSPQPGAATLARIGLEFSTDAPSRMADAALEAMRETIPAARSLPLLEALAQRANGRVVLDYLEHSRLAIDMEASPSA